MNAQIPGSFMAVFWLLVIGVFALVIAVITKLYCQHKRNSDLIEKRKIDSESRGFREANYASNSTE
jgi:hypothetical protein